MNLGEISIGVGLEESSLDNSIRKLQDKVKSINFTLNPGVNHQPLTDLNRHLDKKVIHFRQVNRIFKSEPLTPFGDIRQLDRMERLVNDMRKMQQAQVFRATPVRVPSTSNISYASNYGNLERSIDNSIRNGIRQGVRQGFKDAGKGNLVGGALNIATAPLRGVASGIGTVATAPFKLAQKAIENVLVGTFQGFGQKTSYKFAEGFYKNLENRGKLNLYKSGMDSARYGDIRAKQFTRSAANSLNYRSTEDFTNDLKAVIRSTDTFVNPRKLVKLADNITETVAFLYDKAIIQNDPKGALKDITINPIKAVGMQSMGRVSDFVEKMTNPRQLKKDYVKALKVRKEAGLEPLNLEQYLDTLKPKREFQLAGLAAKTIGIVPSLRTRVANYGALREIDEKSKKINLPDLSNSKGVTITTGGFQKQRGRGAREIADQVKMFFPENDILPVANTYTDRKATDNQSDLLKFISKLGYKVDSSHLDTVQNFEKLVGTAYKGKNPDAVKIAATIKAIKDKYPDLPIGATTFSGGTYPLEQAIGYTTKMGYNDVKGVGTGAGLYGISGKYNPNYEAVIGQQDPLTFPFQMVKPSANTTTIKNFADSSGMEIHAPKYYFSDKNVQRNLAKLPGFEAQDIDKAATQEMIFLEGRRAKINKYIKRANKFFENPLSVPENKLNEAFSEFGDILAKQQVFFAESKGEGNSVRESINKLKNTGHTPTMSAFGLYGQAQNATNNISSVLSKMYDVSKISKDFGKYSPSEQIATLQASSKVQSESKGLNYTFDLLEGKQKEDKSKYSFYTSDKAQQPKRLQDLTGLINYLENKLFKNLPTEVDALAQEYLQFLNEFKASLKNLYETGTEIPQELLMQREKISKFTAPVNESFVNQLKERQSLQQIDTSKLSEKARYKLESRLSRINSNLDLPLPYTEIPVSKVKGGYDMSAISKLDQSKNIAGNFSAAYKNLQKAIKSGNFELATELANGIKQGAVRAQEEIKGVRRSLGANARMGTPTGDRLAQAQGQISRVANLAEGAARKAGLQTTGQDVQAGFVIGIKQGSKSVAKAGEATALELTHAVKEALGVQSPSKVFKRIGEEVVRGFDRGLDAFDGSHNEFKSRIYDFIGTGLRVKILAGAFNFLKDYAPILIETAANFERLGTKLQFAVGSVDGAKAKFSELKQESKELGTNFQDTVSSYADLAASTKDTSLQGYATDLLNRSISEASTVRQLDRQSVANVRLGIGQVANKGVVQREEIVGQISERLTGTLPIAARSQSMSLPEFNKATKRGLSSEDFLPKFAQQLSAESAISLPNAIESTTAKVNRFENALMDLQAAFGKPLLDTRNLGLTALTPILETLSQFAGSLALLMTTLGVTILNKSVRSIVEFAIKAGLLNTAFGTLRGTIRLISPEILKIGAQFVGMTVAIEIIQALTRAFSDASGELKQFGEQSERSFNKLKDVISEQNKLTTASRFTNVKDTNTILRDGEGTNFLKESAIGQGLLSFLPSSFNKKTDDGLTELGFIIRGAVQELESKVGNFSEKAKNDRIRNSDKVANVSNQTVTLGDNELNNSFAKLAELDKTLERLQLKRRALVIANPNDTQGLKEIKQQEQDILTSREKISKVTGGIQAQTAQNIESLKSTIAELNKAALIPSEYQATYRQQAEKLTEVLRNAEESQLRLNRAIKNGVDVYTLMGRRVDRILASIADSATSRGMFTNAAKSQLNTNQFSGGITAEQNSFISQQLDVSASISEFKKLTDSIAQITQLINERGEVLQSYGVGVNTGEAELTNLSEQLNEAPNDKLVIDKLIELKKIQKQASDLGASITQQQAALSQNLYEMGKAVSDFMQDIANETQSLANETKQLQNTIALNSAKSKLKSALLGQQDSFVSSYVESLIGMLDTLNQPLQQAIQAQSELIQRSQGAQAKLLQSQQLGRSNPYLVKGQYPDETGGNNAGGSSISTGYNFSSPVRRNGFQIVEAVRGRTETVNNYDDLEVHHPSRGNQGREGNRSYQNIRGRLEEVNAQGHIKKDFVLLGGKVDAPAVASGRVSAVNPSIGRVNISDVQGKLVGVMLHLEKIAVKVGDIVQYGQTVGKQGGAGGYAVHMHVEGSENQLRNYIRDLKDGTFDLPAQSQARGSNVNTFTANKSNTAPKNSSVLSPGLTAKGRQYAALAEQPQVKAFLRAIRIAEVGENLVNRGEEYGKQIGGNYNKAEFSNPSALTSIPKSLPGRGGQNAFGGYQIHQPDLDWAKRELGVRNLSPANQDIIGVQRLMYRGAIEPLLKGDLNTAIKKAGIEFASLQGSKYAGDGLNATTAGGKLSTFTRNYQNALNGNAPTQRASVNTFTAGSQNAPQNQGISVEYQTQFQDTLVKSNNQILQNYQQQASNLQQQLNSTTELSRLEASLQKTKAENTFEQGLRDSESGARNAQRKLQDLNAQNGYETPEKQKQQQIIQVEREYFDMNSDLVRQLKELESARTTLVASQEVIKKGGFQGAEQLQDQLPMIGDGIVRLDDAIAKVSGVLDQSSKSREARLNDINKKAEVEQRRRNRESSIEIRRQQISGLRNQADLAEANAGGNIGDISRGDALALRNQANEIEALTNLDEQLAQLEQLEQTGERTTEQLAKLRKEYQLLATQQIEQGNFQYQQQISERLLKIDERSLEIKARSFEYDRQGNDLKASSTELFMQKKPFDFSRGNPLEMRFKSDLEALQIEQEQQVLSERRFGLERKIPESEIQRGVNRIQEIYGLKRENITSQFQNNADEQTRNVISNRRAIEARQSNSTTSLIDAGAETYNQFGLNIIGNRDAKKSGKLKLELELANDIADLNEFARTTGMAEDEVSKLRDELERLNEIKLNQLDNQFNPWVEVAQSGVNGLKDSIKGLIDGTMSFGDAFMNIGATVADTLSKLAAEWVTNELVQGLFGGKFKQKQSTFDSGLLGGLFGEESGSGMFGLIGSVLGFKDGGDVPYLSGAGLRNRPDEIGNALRREGNSSVLAALTPGEKVLTIPEAMKYNRMFPQGINKVMNFNKGGNVPGKINISQAITSGKGDVYNVNVPVNMSDGNDSTGKDARLANVLRAAVVNEISRQKQPGGILA